MSASLCAERRSALNLPLHKAYDLFFNRGSNCQWRKRYEKELRPILIGPPERHDATLKFWLEAYLDKPAG